MTSDTTIPVFTTPADMRAWSAGQRGLGRRIGVVPTMGALHAGHLELIEAIRADVDDIVATIFVNPLQFNQTADFDSYPRPIDDDLEACRAAGVSAVYAPTAAAMYPPGYQTHVEPGDLAERLEGPMRPGHFRGVVTVCTKLFGATLPHVAAFGQKDYQQLAIIRRLVADLDMEVRIVGVPIVREPDGLAMSSRNIRLTPDDRQRAVVISTALGRAADLIERGERQAAAVIAAARHVLAAEPRADVEYVELVDAATLEPVESITSPVCLLAAAWFGDVRLIDNRVVTPSPTAG